MVGVKLINTNITGASGISLLHGSLSYSWKNLVQVDPSDSAYGNQEAQQNGWENPTFNMMFHLPIGTSYVDGSTYLNWEKWNQLSKNLYDGTSATQTKLQVSVKGNVLFSDYSASSSNTAVTDIPIIIKGYSLSFGPEDSDGGYFWTINAQCQVTK
jgi:hypothetical protein